MSKPMFLPATREQTKLYALLGSPPGNGKSFTALMILSYLLSTVITFDLERRIAVICSENGRIRRYAAGNPFYFHVCVLEDFSPESYIAAILEAKRAGFEALLVDSVSDEWEWVLHEIDRLQTSEGGRLDKRSAWGVMTPRHNAFLRTLTRVDMHVIATMLLKPEYAMVPDPKRDGKMKMERIGLAPVQREGIERLFDIAGNLETAAELYFTKTMCSTLFDRKFSRPGKDLADIISEWIKLGDPVPLTVPEMVVALTEKSALAKEAYEEAKVTLKRWCLARGVSREGFEQALGDLKNAVLARVLALKGGSGVVAPVLAAANPPPAPSSTPKPAESSAPPAVCIPVVQAMETASNAKGLAAVRWAFPAGSTEDATCEEVLARNVERLMDVAPDTTELIAVGAIARDRIPATSKHHAVLDEAFRRNADRVSKPAATTATTAAAP